jgi:hypothetical protein
MHDAGAIRADSRNDDKLLHVLSQTERVPVAEFFISSVYRHSGLRKTAAGTQIRLIYGRRPCRWQSRAAGIGFAAI